MGIFNDTFASPTGGALEKKKAIKPSGIFNEVFPRGEAPKIEKKKGIVERIKGVGVGALKFGARVGVEAFNLGSSTIDFASDFLSGTVKRTIQAEVAVGKKLGIKGIEESGSELANRWKTFYGPTTHLTEEAKKFTENLREIDFIKPSDEWAKSSTKDKFTKKLPETILNIGPGVVSSIGAFALNPVVGFVVSAGSTADEVKSIAVENGIEEDRASLIGLGTGLLIGWMDKIVPDEVFSPQQKKTFIGGVTKRIIKTGTKEVGTEMGQEGVQLAVEATLREDLGMDEATSRVALSGLGGFLGGAGSQTMVSFVNNVQSGEIGGRDTRGDFKGADDIDVSDITGKKDAEDTDVPSTKVREIEVDGNKITIERPTTEIIKPENRMIHAGKSTVETVKERGVFPSETGIFGKALYLGQEKSKLDWGSGEANTTYELDSTDFNLIKLDTKAVEESFIKKQGLEPISKNLTKALQKEGTYDGAIITNPSEDIGDTFVIHNLEKVNQVLRGEEKSPVKKVIKRSSKIVDGKRVFKKELVEVPVKKVQSESQRVVNVAKAERDRIKSLKVVSEDQRSKMLKTSGFETSALKRAIERSPTQRETEKTLKFLNSVHSGRTVTYKGDPATATGKVSFGKHEIKLKDGSTKFVERRDLKLTDATRKNAIEHLRTEAIKKLEGREDALGIKKEVRKEVAKPKKPVKPVKKVVKKIERVVKEKKTLKDVTAEKIKNVKDAKTARSVLKDIKTQLDQAVAEAEGIAVIAVEQRAGVDTVQIAQLKRIVSLNKKFKEGDIETIRGSKSGGLLDSVIESVQEAHPEMSEQEAFDFAMNLPTKADEKGRTPNIVDLERKEKKLRKHLDQLKEKQKELSIKEEGALASEWEKALSVQEELVEIVKVPATQLPVGEGKVKVSRLEARTKNQLGNLTEAEIEKLGLATYNQVNKKENIAKASVYVANNQEEALRVIKGEIDPPKGILVNSVYVALHNLGATDTDVATKVASLGATRMGQEISILSEILKDSPVTMMESVVKTRIEAFEKRTGKKVSAKIKSEKKKIDQDLKPPSARQWDSFLKEIVC